MLPVIWPFGISIFHCSLSLTSLITDSGNINKNYPRLTSRRIVARQPSCCERSPTAAVEESKKEPNY